mgnify:CR=1 FL=1
MNDIVKVAWKHAHTRALSSDRLKTNVAVFSTDFDRFYWKRDMIICRQSRLIHRINDNQKQELTYL